MSARTTRTSPISSLFGIGPLVVRSAPARGETIRIEDGHVDRRASVEQPLRHEPARGRRMLEAVATEADGEEEPFDARRPPDDRVLVGRERAQPGPSP